jgi:hypothetical protein
VPSLQPALPYVLFHHERWDGRGYPTRRSGTGRPTGGSPLAASNSRPPTSCRTPSFSGPHPTTSGRSPSHWFGAGYSRPGIVATRHRWRSSARGYQSASGPAEARLVRGSRSATRRTVPPSG